MSSHPPEHRLAARAALGRARGRRGGFVLHGLVRARRLQLGHRRHLRDLHLEANLPGHPLGVRLDLRDASGGGAETELGLRDLVHGRGAPEHVELVERISSNRYVEFDFNSPPRRRPRTARPVQLPMASNGGADTGCFYFEVYRASTSNPDRTHGSTGTPVACDTATQTTAPTTLAEVTTRRSSTTCGCASTARVGRRQAVQAGHGDRHGVDAVELHDVRDGLPRPGRYDPGDDELGRRDRR